MTTAIESFKLAVWWKLEPAGTKVEAALLERHETCSSKETSSESDISHYTAFTTKECLLFFCTLQILNNYRENFRQYSQINTNSTSMKVICQVAKYYLLEAM